MKIDLAAMFREYPGIQDYIEWYCRQAPQFAAAEAAFQQVNQRLFDALIPRHRRTFYDYDAAVFAYFNYYIEGAFYAGLGLRTPVLDALGASDGTASGSQMRS